MNVIKVSAEDVDNRDIALDSAEFTALRGVPGIFIQGGPKIPIFLRWLEYEITAMRVEVPATSEISNRICKIFKVGWVESGGVPLEPLASYVLTALPRSIADGEGAG